MNPIERKVLIVGDNSEDYELYRRCLLRDRRYDYRILTAQLGQLGLDLWQHHQPDVVLLADRLPDMDSLEFITVRKTLTRQPFLPVIVVTKEGNESIALATIKAGAEEYLVKEQITTESLRLAINGTIETVKLRTQLQLQNQLAKVECTTEEILPDSEEQLRLALEAARMGAWNWNILTGQIQWSTNMEALFGLSPGEFDGSFATFIHCLHPDDREEVQKALHAALSTGTDYDIVFRVVLPNGRTRWTLNKGKVYDDRTGQPLRMAGVTLDITERKRAAEAVKESEERFRQLAENIDAVFWIVDFPNRQISYVSPAYERLWGFNPESLYASKQAWVNSIHPEDRASIERAFQKKAAEGKFDEEYRIILPDGSVRWVRDRCFPLKDETGMIYRFAGIAEDITDRKQTEAALRQSEARYRYLADAIPQLVWTCDAQGFTDYANQRLCDYTGLTIEEALGVGWLSKVHPDDVQMAQEVWETAVATGTFYQHEYRFQRAADGSYRWHLVLGLPVKDEQGRVVKWFGTCTDVHDRKELEVERDRILQLEKSARAESERTNRIKDEFLAVLSHELRSPLNPILGWTKLLQTRKFDATKTAEALAIIERNAKLQIQLIDDLLDIAKILRGKLSLNAAPVNLKLLIEAAIETVQTAAAAKSIVIHSLLPNIGQVCGDAVRLQQIVWNLLSNAIKFTSNGGKVEIRLERADNEAQIVVSDTGKGIKPEFLPHIFESFCQEDASVTRKHGGLGLGLAIVYSLVELHGGTIAADSPGEEQGATFTVKLPLLNVQPEVKPAEEKLKPECDLRGIRVLAIEDRLDSRELLRVLLVEYGAQVMAVASKSEFLEALESFSPDVLVSDIGMPEVDGYTLLRQVRCLSPDRGGKIPAIALSAYAREEDYQRALAAGFQMHLSKPIDPSILVAAIFDLTAFKKLDKSE
jgi:PAS domain S-box-containing protein